jgi:hypothetical protein
MSAVNLFGAGLMLGIAIGEMGQRRWKAMAGSLLVFAVNLALWWVL